MFGLPCLNYYFELYYFLFYKIFKVCLYFLVVAFQKAFFTLEVCLKQSVSLEVRCKEKPSVLSEAWIHKTFTKLKYVYPVCHKLIKSC